MGCRRQRNHQRGRVRRLLSGAGLFDDWDAEGDGLVGSSELAEGLYGFRDANGDGDLSDDEWDSDFWFSEDDVNLALSEDANGDATISEFEFVDALGESYLLARFDRDDDACSTATAPRLTPWR